MSKYVQIRGWLECSGNDIDIIKTIIDESKGKAKDFIVSEEVCNLYSKGWVLPKSNVNWTRYVFFGLDASEAYDSFFEYQVTQIALMIPEVSGVFALTYESCNAFELWVIANEKINKKDCLTFDDLRLIAGCFDT